MCSSSLSLTFRCDCPITGVIKFQFSGVCEQATSSGMRVGTYCCRNESFPKDWRPHEVFQRNPALGNLRPHDCSSTRQRASCGELESPVRFMEISLSNKFRCCSVAIAYNFVSLTSVEANERGKSDKSPTVSISASLSSLAPRFASRNKGT